MSDHVNTSNTGLFWFAIPVHNRCKLTLSCIRTIEQQKTKNYRVVVCDDGSTDNTQSMVSQNFPDVVVLEGNGELWWTGATNRCIDYILKHATEGDYVITLNNDLELDEDYLSAVSTACKTKPDTLFMSASYDINQPERLVDPGHTMIWALAKSKPVTTPDSGNNKLVEVTHAPGRGCVVPVGAYRHIGLYDEAGLPHYGADYDFTHRARRSGYRVFINYDAKLYSHVEETGNIAFRGKRSIKGLFHYLTGIKSPACLKYRWRFAINNCPPVYLPIYLVLDTVRTVGSYILGKQR